MGAIVAVLTAIGGPLINLIAKMFGGGGDKDQRELGRAEQQNADSKEDIATIKRANKADKAAADAAERDKDNDPNDRSKRR